MMNNVENKNDLNKMSDLEFGKNQVEMMRYRDNSLSYKLGLGGLVFSVLACFFCLNGFNPTSFTTLIAIMLNIVILLGGFLGIEKTKSYSMKGSISLIVFGGMCAARIFWIPLQLLTYFPKYMDFINGKTTDNSYEKYLGKTITSAYAATSGSYRWLPANGTFRGIFAVILLVIAAATFIGAGVIGYIRSKKLSTYLDSLKVNE